MIIMLVLVMLLLMELMIIININYKNKLLINKLNEEENIIVAYVKKHFDLLKENGKLKTKNENLKIIIDEQEQKINKLRKSIIDYSDSKIDELETKYKSSLIKINERDEKIRLLNSEIYKYDKCNKQIAEELRKKNNVIEDSYIRIKNMEQEKQLAINQRNNANEEKQLAIHQSKRCIKLCNEMSIRFKLINSELEAIELQLLGKLNP